MRRRRVVAVATVAAALILTLLFAADALAAAGGGSSGFGGRGGGGGRGAGLYILIQILIRVALFGHGLGILILLGVIALVIMFQFVAPRARDFQTAQREAGRTSARQLSQRQRRTELAAAEAAEEDPAFSPDVVRAQAGQLFDRIQAGWDAGDLAQLSSLVAPELLAQWRQRLEGFRSLGWRNRVQVVEEPAVTYVGLHHGADADEDRVTVLVQARLRDYVEDRYGNRLKRVGRLSETIRIREYWTLRKGAGGKWILASIEQGAEGSHALSESPVATPWSDDQALRDSALVEHAVEQAVPEGTKVAEVADLDFRGDAKAAALDLSLADGRFSPNVLEVAVRQAVAAWTEAVDGRQTSLRRIASPAAVRDLLEPRGPGGTRIVVRGPVVKQISIVGVEAAAEPARMEVEVELEAVRYLEDSTSLAVLSGSRATRERFTERWTLALSGDAERPWRLVAASAPPAPVL